MSSPAAPRTDVMIAGAGPVGLMAALSLAREGVAVRIVDPAPSPSRHSKAMVLQPAALEALQRVGVAEALVGAGLPVLAYNMYDARGRRLVRHEMQGLPARFSFALHVSQHDTERQLILALRDAGVEVERGLGVASFSQSEAEVLVGLSDGSNARARYLLGCDGSRSTVRRAAGIELRGMTYPERFVLADCQVDSELEPQEAHSFLAPEGILSVLPLRECQRIILPMSRGALRTCEGEERGDAPGLTEDMLRAWVDQRRPPTTELRLRRIEWLSDFRIHCRIAQRYRLQRVFLCGDAAHIHSPAGGQGLNVGLQDAFELAWRLALVLRSNASHRLLDSYEPERSAVAQRVLVQTHRLTRMFTTRSALGRGARRAFFALAGHVPSLRRKIRLEMAGLSDRYAGEGVLCTDSPRSGYLRSGERLPHVAVESERIWLSDLERRPMLLLLIADDSEQAARLSVEAHRLAERYPTPPRLVLVAPDRVAAPAQVRVLVDAEGNVRRATGMDVGATLIRPDGRIAWAAEGTACTVQRGGSAGAEAILNELWGQRV